MKKLRIEDIQVESYETQAESPGRGTVQAHADTVDCGEITPVRFCISLFVTRCPSCFSDIICCP